jgi:RimJ/RimL family protein N-acetyltransferase
MKDITLNVCDGVSLSLIQIADKPAMIHHLRDREIYERTAVIPYPYTELDADWWINNHIESRKTRDDDLVLAIRDSKSELIGVIGAHVIGTGALHRAEFGYWLAKPFWGQGIMTATVRVFVNCLFEEMHLLKISADVFAFNTASVRVLEKNGFKKEGFFRKHYLKDGNLIDAYAYGLLREEFNL